MIPHCVSKILQVTLNLPKDNNFYQTCILCFRQSMLQLTKYINDQSAKLTPYTRLGYKKMNIPAELYKLILGEV